MDIGHGLRLYTLRRIHDQDRTLAGGQASGNLIGKIDMARCVEKIKSVLQPILCFVLHRHGMCLDRDTSLAF